MEQIVRAILLLMAVVLVEGGLPNQCENYLLLRDVVPSEEVHHPVEKSSHPLYKKILQEALAHPNSNSKVVVDTVYNFISQSVRGYHYYVKFSGSIYNTVNGPCSVEWIHIPFVPNMPKVIKGVDCSWPAPKNDEV